MTAQGTLLGSLLRLSAQLQICHATAKDAGDAELVTMLRDASWKVTAAIARLSRTPAIDERLS